MKNATRSALALLLGANLLVSPAYAATAEEYFQRGVTAFKADNYQNALREFEQAQKAGLHRPALSFNLGVCYYRVGRYAEATTAFSAAAQHKPLTAIAHYNLGLVAKKQGKTATAQRWFRLAASEATDPKLRALARQQLADETASGNSSPWVIGVNAAVGYDDNLLDPTKQAGSSKGSGFGTVLAYGSGMVSGHRNDGWRLDLSGYFSRYSSQSYFDMNMYQAGVARVLPWGRWTTEIGGQFEHDTLGGNDYLRTTSLVVGALRPLHEDLRLRLRYRYSNINSLSTAYDPLQGSRHEARVQLEQRRDRARLRYGYELELNNRNDLTVGSSFTSYSATRHTFFAGGEMDLQGPWRLGGELSYRLSRYNDANTVTGRPTRITRDDRRLIGSVRLIREVSDKLKLQAEYSHTDNSSNISGYSYNRNIYSVGLNYLF